LNTKRHVMRGITLIEVSIALAVLAIASLGLAGSLVVSSNSNALAARRTVMSSFAQARIESLTSMTRTKIPLVGTAGSFDPMSAPNTGGWVMDTIDGYAPDTGVNAAWSCNGGACTSGMAGDDLFWGPVLVNPVSQNGGDGDALLTRTKALRASGAVQSCADNVVTSDPSILCREVHIESYWQGTTPPVPMLRAYVRVIQGGPKWQSSYVLLQQDIAQ
jgi:prepilin-type N-terminal cleavage/methylation domain-containing protein